MFKVAATITKKLSPIDGCVNRSRTPDPEKQPLLRSEAPLPPAFDKKAHRLQYATELEEKEIMDGLRENPSIDPETQQQILLDYRELHEQIKAEGLYKCNYSAYGYESIRYATLFASFAFLLYHQWYLTSALFLGLFWVGSLVCRQKYLLIFSSNKSCSPHTTPATAAYPATL
jgi:delta8-fatty-acid desaturase